MYFHTSLLHIFDNTSNGGAITKILAMALVIEKKIEICQICNFFFNLDGALVLTMKNGILSSLKGYLQTITQLVFQSVITRTTARKTTTTAKMTTVCPSWVPRAVTTTRRYWVVEESATPPRCIRDSRLEFRLDLRRAVASGQGVPPRAWLDPPAPRSRGCLSDLPVASSDPAEVSFKLKYTRRNFFWGGRPPSFHSELSMCFSAWLRHREWKLAEWLTAW